VSERVIEAEIVEARIVTCPQCGQRNRLYRRTAAGVHKCGACHAALPNPFATTKTTSSMQTIGIAAAAIIVLLVIIAMLGGNSSSPSISPPSYSTSRAVSVPAAIPTISIAPLSEPALQLAVAPPGEIPATVIPINNEILFDAYPESRFRGELSVDNGTSNHAVAKLIDVQTDQKILSFVIAARQKAMISAIPDGAYQLIFAFGDRLYLGTDRFHSPHGFSKFVRQLTFETKSTEDAIYWSQLSVTLHPVFAGNAKTSSISQKEFERY
jgi:ribosomal protein L37AE/L43A